MNITCPSCFDPKSTTTRGRNPKYEHPCSILGFRPLLVVKFIIVIILYLIKKTRHTRATGVGFPRVILSEVARVRVFVGYRTSNLYPYPGQPVRQTRAGCSTCAMPYSDGHGFENPCRFAGTGHAGTGAGDQILTRDLPVPVWAGDGSVIGSHQGDMSTSTPHQRDANAMDGCNNAPMRELG